MVMSMLPNPSMPPVTLLPATIGSTPAGVPVMIRSPGLSIIERDRIEIISGTGQINSGQVGVLFHRAVDREPDPTLGWVLATFHPMDRRNRRGLIERLAPIPGAALVTSFNCRSRRVRSMPTP
jgi:hypothetical protein